MGTKQLQLDSLLQETSPQDIYHAVCHLGSLYSCLHASGRCSSASSHAWFCLATSFEASYGPVDVDDDDADGPGKWGQQHDATHDDDDDDGRTGGGMQGGMMLPMMMMMMNKEKCKDDSDCQKPNAGRICGKDLTTDQKNHLEAGLKYKIKACCKCSN